MADLKQMKLALKEADSRLALGAEPLVVLHAFERDGRVLRLALSPRLRRLARKGRVWRSKELLITLKNASYGFDEALTRSVGGADGVFLLDRAYRPPNAMMKKLFDRYLDKPGSGAEELAAALGTTLAELLPVRLVSHHMRLLGVLHRSADADVLVLVDWDREK